MKNSNSHIDLSLLTKLTNGDEIKELHYLRQFLDLIPKKVIELKRHLANFNHKEIRTLVHHIGPQLIFFGVPEVKKVLKLIEEEIESMSKVELQKTMDELLVNIEKAVDEVNSIVMKIKY